MSCPSAGNGSSPRIRRWFRDAGQHYLSKTVEKGEQRQLAAHDPEYIPAHPFTGGGKPFFRADQIVSNELASDRDYRIPSRPARRRTTEIAMVTG